MLQNVLTADIRMQPITAAAVHGYVWRDGTLGYSLVGAQATTALHPLADAVRR